ncbi:FAD/NAD(P)-binding protein [Amycolatopsis sp. NPDC059657]|uniref:FAD/NAD(P)-binding protein n=1 Tax=Amycolatopsis sp. NPDC059657 TaxID=3346899 RepID=UPI00366A8075
MRVAVIGGGAGLVSLLDSLLARAGELPAGLELDVFEPGDLARGGAFGPDLDSALINLPNSAMSIRDHQRGHFADWLRLRGDSGDHDLSFAPRRVFGDYLADQLARCRAEAEAWGWRVTVRREVVVAVSDVPGGMLVRGDEARRYDQVVLCVGPGSAADPYALAGEPGFHRPYPLASVLPRVASRARVLIVGTGLTAVDTVLGLLELGHEGPITMASRRGVLPGVLSAAPHRRLRFLTPERVAAGVTAEDIWELLHAELAAAGVDGGTETAWLRQGASAAGYLRHQLAHGNAVQSIFMSVPTPLAREIRRTMPGTPRLVARYRPQLKSLQCPMPSATARKLLAAMDAGRLSVHSGLDAVRHESGVFRTGAGLSADVVVDATRTSPRRTTGLSRELLAGLTASGNATWDAYDALRVDPVTCRILLPSGAAHPRLSAMGELTAGDIYYAASLPAVNRAADAVAASLAEVKA